MRIENLVFLIGGELKSSPSICEINDFSFDAHSLKRGNLFFAKNKNEIDVAIQNGAYAVIFEGWTQIVDSEIAWIKVENLEIAALKLLRFYLIQKDIPIIKFDQLEYDIFKSISNDKNVLYIDDDFINSFINLYKKDIKFAIIKDIEILKKISLDFLTPNIEDKINITKSYIFETSFIYKNSYFERVHIAPIFIKSLNKVLNILDSYNIDYVVKNIEKLNHFKPIFIDNSFNIKEFGKSDKVLILEDCYNLLNIEKEFLEKNIKWAKKIYISDRKIKEFIYEKDFDKIREVLYNLTFNFALIGAKNFPVEKLGKTKIYKSLF